MTAAQAWMPRGLILSLALFTAVNFALLTWITTTRIGDVTVTPLPLLPFGYDVADMTAFVDMIRPMGEVLVRWVHPLNTVTSIAFGVTLLAACCRWGAMRGLAAAAAWMLIGVDTAENIMIREFIEGAPITADAVLATSRATTTKFLLMTFCLVLLLMPRSRARI
ncbi:hypothetical protein ACXN5S_13725 [Pseudoroseicyclus sp. H15]